MRKNIVLFLTAIFVLGAVIHFLWSIFGDDEYFFLYWFGGVMGVLALIAAHDMLQTKNSILKNYPIVGHMRYLLREISPELNQYFVEGNTDGRPFNKNQIALVNSRADQIIQTHPFGTEHDVYKDGMEWLPHSMFPKHLDMSAARVTVGGEFCTQPYSASLMNISAMSYGSLSSRAILSLNGGAKDGGFYHNTGEGSISPFHLENGGDLVWQIGTGYFGCRTKDGKFDPEKFREKAVMDNVKMIEIKLSQGAKPGHGGILPAIKNTPEIAEIRGLEPHTTVFSPPAHSAFDSYEGLLEFVHQLRELSGGKPVGFKLCVGNRREVREICQAMVKTGMRPDFVTVDGSEGGTGAAPLEFSDHIGMPGEEALAYVSDMLRGYGLKKDIRIIYSGKVISGFDVVRALAVGADLCNSARAMMFALGCIQSLRCHANTCPVGVATQNKSLERGLNVKTKRDRVAHFHRETVLSALEMLGATGLDHPSKIDRTFLYQWSGENNRSMRLDEIYPLIPAGSYLKEPSLVS